MVSTKNIFPEEGDFGIAFIIASLLIHALLIWSFSWWSTLPGIFPKALGEKKASPLAVEVVDLPQRPAVIGFPDLSGAEPDMPAEPTQFAIKGDESVMSEPMPDLRPDVAIIGPETLLSGKALPDIEDHPDPPDLSDRPDASGGEGAGEPGTKSSSAPGTSQKTGVGGGKASGTPRAAAKAAPVNIKGKSASEVSLPKTATRDTSVERKRAAKPRPAEEGPGEGTPPSTTGEIAITTEPAPTPLEATDGETSEPTPKERNLPSVQKHFAAVEDRGSAGGGEPGSRGTTVEAAPGGGGASADKRRAQKGLSLLPTEETLQQIVKNSTESVPDASEWRYRNLGIGSGEGKIFLRRSVDPKYLQYALYTLRRIVFYGEYPLAARRRGQQGKVWIDLKIYKDGTIEAASLAMVKSSGYPILDNAVSTAIRLATPFNSFPVGMEDDFIIIPYEFIFIYHRPPPVQGP